MLKYSFRSIFSFLVVFFVSTIETVAQKSIEETLEKYNSGSIAYIYVNELQNKLENNDTIVLLDSRSIEEYTISHLKDAVWIGNTNFDKSRVEGIDYDSELIIYCSVGVRSEKIGEKLKLLGFNHIKNLYGGIFLWNNNGLPIYKDGKQTDTIHGYNKRWSQFIIKGKTTY